MLGPLLWQKKTRSSCRPCIPLDACAVELWPSDMPVIPLRLQHRVYPDCHQLLAQGQELMLGCNWFWCRDAMMLSSPQGNWLKQPSLSSHNLVVVHHQLLCS